jgi:succinylarginine dihydrolase
MSEKDFGTKQTVDLVSIEQLIERWWSDHFSGSTIAHDTQAWNVAHVAKEKLKQLLKGSI